MVVPSTFSSGNFVGWVFFCSYVLPLTRRAGVSDLLYSVGHEHMKLSGIVPNVAREHLTVSPERFVYVSVVEFLPQD